MKPKGTKVFKIPNDKGPWKISTLFTRNDDDQYEAIQRVNKTTGHKSEPALKILFKKSEKGNKKKNK